MGKVFILGKMEINMLETFSSIKEKALDSTIGKMVVYTRVSGVLIE